MNATEPANACEPVGGELADLRVQLGELQGQLVDRERQVDAMAVEIRRRTMAVGDNYLARVELAAIEAHLRTLPDEEILALAGVEGAAPLSHVDRFRAEIRVIAKLRLLLADELTELRTRQVDEWMRVESTSKGG